MGKPFDPAKPDESRQQLRHQADADADGATLEERRSALRAPGLLSLLIFVAIVGLWQVATMPTAASGPAMDPEYAKLVGAAAATGSKSAMPTPADIGATIWKHLSDPFYVRGSNDKGIGIQLAYSLGRVLLGFGLAALFAVPLGFLIGMSPLVYRALDPFIQILKPVSPLAWMPLGALHDQGQRHLVDLRDLHLLGLADADQHRVRRGERAPRMAERGAHARGRAVPHRLQGDPAGRGADHHDRHAHLRSASPGW